MKVLVVEDDEDQLAVRAMLLENAGYQVTAAATSDAALRAAECDSFHCAVVDLRIPSESDGVALLQALAARHPQLHLIVLSGGAIPPGTPHHAAFRKGLGPAALLEALAAVNQ